MTILTYFDLKRQVIEKGYGDELSWAGNIKACQSADDFWSEYGWTVMCTGMKEQVVRRIWDRIRDNLMGKNPNAMKAMREFQHKGKMLAIIDVWLRRQIWFEEWQAREADGQIAQLAWLMNLPWIGKITCYHLAKNLGVDVCKPDRHLVRIAADYDETPVVLCGRLAHETGDPIALVDTVLWRAANLGMI